MLSSILDSKVQDLDLVGVVRRNNQFGMRESARPLGWP